MLTRWLLCAISLFQVLNFPAAAAEGKHSGEFLVISDIHFNPFANKELFPALAARPVSEWGRIFESSLTDGVSQLGNDTNYVLLASCFAAAVERCPRPDFVLYAG
jgi:sphingomyelin phosphodiesterase acid-like 3